MDRDTVIRLARDAGFERHDAMLNHPKELQRFAALVEQHLTYDSIHSCHPNCDKPACVAIRAAVQAEREECAKVCEAEMCTGSTGVHEVDAAINETALACAAAIRSRT